MMSLVYNDVPDVVYSHNENFIEILLDKTPVL